MGSSMKDLLVHEQNHLENIFSNTGGIIATHAEDESRLRPRIVSMRTASDIGGLAQNAEMWIVLSQRTKRAADLVIMITVCTSCI